MYDFEYMKPVSLSDAIKILADEEALALAGGQTLLPTLKQRLASPTKLIDLKAIPDLKGIDCNKSAVIIKSMTTHSEIASDPQLASILPALTDLAATIGDPQVRHRGTIGGSLANNDPAADYAAACLALNATIKTIKRTIKADDFFQGLFTTCLDQGELITAVELPVTKQAAYCKFKQPASRYAMAGVFVAIIDDEVRVSITGAGDNGVFRCTPLEQALTADFSPAALREVTISANDLISDIHGSGHYRASLIVTLATRAVAKIKQPA